jgi:hypothetical protein
MASKKTLRRQRTRQRQAQRAAAATVPARGDKHENWAPGTSGNPAGSSQRQRSESSLISLITARMQGLEISEAISDEVLAEMFVAWIPHGSFRFLMFAMAIVDRDFDNARQIGSSLPPPGSSTGKGTPAHAREAEKIG